MSTIHLEVESGQNLARLIGRSADEFYDSSSILKNQSNRLNNSWQGGISGDFIHEIRKCSDMLMEYTDQLEYLGVSLGNEINQWIAVDLDGSKQFQSAGFISQFFPGLIGGSIIAGLVSGGDIASIIAVESDAEYFLINGVERKYYSQYLQGDITFEEMLDRINNELFEKDIVKGKITFWESEEAAARAAVMDGQIATGLGLFSGSLLSAEAKGKAKAEFKDGNLQAKGEFDSGAYLAKGTWSAEEGALSAVAVGFLGAEVSGEGGIIVNPMEGDVKLNAELDAFAGGKLEGEAELGGEIAGVDVSGGVSGGVSYGVGATAKADIGFEDGHFSMDCKLGATIGLGAEIGFNFEVDVEEAAVALFDAGQQSMAFLF